MGNGNVTQTKSFITDAESLDTVSQYDWRDRLVQARGPDDIVSMSVLDNLGRPEWTQTYGDSDRDFQLDSGELRSKSGSRYDEKGQVDQSIACEVRADDTVGNQLVSGIWYDTRGRQIKTASPAGLFSKAQ